MATAARAPSTELAEQLRAATRELTKAGAALEAATKRLLRLQRREDDDPLGKFEEQDAERDLAIAHKADAAARRAFAAAREALFQQQVADFERGEDAAKVRDLIAALGQAAQIERQRVEARREFEQRTGRQVPVDWGGWPELVDDASGGASRLERFVEWAAQHRGYSAK